MDYPFIEKALLNWQGDAPHLFLNAMHPDRDDLFVLGMVEASAEEIAKAKFTAAMASRTNVVLSVPMLLCMIGAGHGGYLF